MSKPEEANRWPREVEELSTCSFCRAQVSQPCSDLFGRGADVSWCRYHKMMLQGRAV